MATEHPLPTNPRFQDLTGKTFGRLTVLKYAGRRPGTHDSYWEYRCACGNEGTTGASGLKKAESCGCLRRARSRARHLTHGLSKTPEYYVWNALIHRCYNPLNRGWERYGKRGITVCQRWRESFEDFLADMGKCPGKGYSIDRIDNARGYEPGNCRWATRHEQANNTRGNRLLTWNGETRTVAEWARVLGIKVNTLYGRLFAGWTIERTLSKSVHR